VKDTVVVLNSLVARGAVGGRTCVFALERMGFPVVFVPTVILPWHPGHGPASWTSCRSPRDRMR
jgi:pyridoxine kinase